MSLSYEEPKVATTVDFSSEVYDAIKIRLAYEPPLRGYARYLERLDKVNPEWADMLRMYYPVTRIYDWDLQYRKNTWKNSLQQITGQQGSLKSFSGISLCLKTDPDFVEWNRGRPYLPKIFWSDEDLQDFAANEALRGDCLMKDEDPRYFGGGSASLTQSIKNLEATQRHAQINFMFVYVEQRTHLIHVLHYARAEHFSRPRNKLESKSQMAKEVGKVADYSVLGVLVPLVGFGAYTLVGMMPVDVPDQRIIDEYQKLKAEFTTEMRTSGGSGGAIDVEKRFGHIIAKLEQDELYQSLTTWKDRADHLHVIYRQPWSLVSVLVNYLAFLEEREKFV